MYRRDYNFKNDENWNKIYVVVKYIAEQRLRDPNLVSISYRFYSVNVLNGMFSDVHSSLKKKALRLCTASTIS